MVTLKAQGQAGAGGWKRQRDWSPNSFNSDSGDTQDADLARAIAASLGQPTGPPNFRHLGLVATHPNQFQIHKRDLPFV